MKVAIVGCGWLGVRLAQFLTAKGLEIRSTTTTQDKLDHLRTVAAEAHLFEFGENPDYSLFNKCDAAIFSMPAAKDDWHEDFKNFNLNLPKTFFFSSTGIYPQNSGTFTEKDTDDLRADLALSEKIVREKFPQTNVFRLAGLMGDERSLTNIFSKRPPQNPHKAVNYIHFEDILHAVYSVLKSDVKSQTYNLVAPLHPTIAEILGLPDAITEKELRIISGDKFIRNFNYKFIHPNPQYFSR